MRDAGEDFSAWVWGMAGGKPIQSSGEILAKSAALRGNLKALKKRGYKFVGPVIVYAWMQAVGIVNDHTTGCFRMKAVRVLGRARRLPRAEPIADSATMMLATITGLDEIANP